MKRYNKFIFILFVTAILSGIATSLEAQDKPKKKKTALIEVKGLVTDNKACTSRLKLSVLES